MSIALIKNVLLRTLSDPNYVAKGSVLNWVELDTDLKIIADAIIELSSVPVDTSGFETWNSGDTYTTSPPSFVAYNGNIWKYINTVSSSGITPGTDPLYWELQSQGQFSHMQNTDQYLDFGGASQVSALEIRTFIDTPIPLGGLVEWSAIATYNPGDPAVWRAGKIWIPTGTSTNEDPGSGSNWGLLVINTSTYGPGWASSPLAPTQAAVYELGETLDRLDGSYPWTGNHNAAGFSIVNVGIASLVTGGLLSLRGDRFSLNRDASTGVIPDTNNFANLILQTKSSDGNPNNNYLQFITYDPSNVQADNLFAINGNGFAAFGSAFFDASTAVNINSGGDNFGLKVRDNSGNKILSVKMDGSVFVDVAGNFGVGDSATNGSWRIRIDSPDLIFEERISGIWTEKNRITG